MNKSVFFRLAEEELAHLEEYCQMAGRTKSDVLRDLIRKLKINKKPSFMTGLVSHYFRST
ncbi:MAG: ribbon-helix-helix protein, CopG family [Nostoc sp. NMS9]|nr:ribbon-helix-helix protein, CopG family [Nostoc sp. NMS9]MBN3941470.1 ribbon-helix-helix protein, CopG family [Nostoc sp. NMS9]